MEGTHIKQERCMELINAIINNLSVAEKSSTVIKYLLHVGFTEEELVKHFNYPEEDVKDAAQEMDDYQDTLIFT